MFIRSSSLAVIAGLASSAVAQSFISPNPPSSDLSPVYTIGQQVTVSWTSPWQYTLLDVWQGAGQNYGYFQLVNASSSQTSYTWTVESLDGTSDLSNENFFFRLINGLDKSQTADSVTFFVQAAASSTTPSSSTTTSTSATSTSASSTSSAASTASSASSTAASTASTAAATSDAAATNAPVSQSAVVYPNYTSSYIGVGVGLGVPFVLVLLVGGLLYLRNKRKARQQPYATEKGKSPELVPTAVPQV